MRDHPGGCSTTVTLQYHLPYYKLYYVNLCQNIPFLSSPSKTK